TDLRRFSGDVATRGGPPFHDVLRRLLHVPDQLHLFHALQDVVGDVDLPPEKALIGAVHVVVVIVVLVFAHRDEREPQVVAAGVGRLVAARTEYVGERVDRERAVREKTGGNHVSLEEAVEPAIDPRGGGHA